MSGRGEIEDSARDEQEPRPDLDALEDARIGKGPLPLSMADSNRLDMQTERKCRDTARLLRELWNGPLCFRADGHVLEYAADLLEKHADHIVQVWD